MIIDLTRFVETERPFWAELQTMVDKMHAEPNWRMSLEEIQRFQYLYERAAAAVVRLDEFSDPQLRAWLRSLVGRTYAQMHETRSSGRIAIRWRSWFVEPARAFRRHQRAFGLSVALTVLGCALGSLAVVIDVRNKAILMPFPALLGSPRERVAAEESGKADSISGHKATFSASLMTHNIRVSLFTLACGVTFGVGTVLILFHNGVILGAVAGDYIWAGQVQFLAGWLLPHGSIEIPAILISGQAGFMLASALIGSGISSSRSQRLRAARGDLVALAAGVAALLIWAGAVEAFISQYHQPVLPYPVKIVFGVVELLALTAYLRLAGRDSQ